ncbi:MAG: hypothetical protein ACREEB_14560 [Caulobacteraceae bacterium]
MAIFALAAVLATAGAATPLPEPIAPASQGQAQCYSPNLAAKTCASIAVYARNAAGVIQNTATVLIAKDPPVTMTTVSPVTATNNRLCGSTRAEDLNAATFTVGGAPADDARALQLHEGVNRAFAPIIDHTLCVTFVADGSQFVAHSALDGLPRPGLDQRVMWVSLADGWKVAP